MRSNPNLKFARALIGQICFCLALALVTLKLLAPSARAQSYDQHMPLAGGTNNISASSTNTSASVILVGTRATYMAIQPIFKLTGAGTSPVVFRFDRSIDSVNWEPTAYSVSVTPAGTATVTAVGSVTLGGIGFLRLSTRENPNSAAVTNLVLLYSVKSGLLP